MPGRTSGFGGGAAPPEEEAYFPPPQSPAPPPPDNYIPGSTYVPDYGQEPLYYEEPAPAPVASEMYGGPSGVAPTGLNDPGYIVTYYPESGAEPTAQATDYFWTQHGRTPPPNYNREFPASALTGPPPPPPRPAPSPNHFMPGPSRNYIPGSTYIPREPLPDPRIPYDERVNAGAKAPINPTRVPGGPLYRMPEDTQAMPYVQPGLGGTGGEGPFSRQGRAMAPRDPNTWIVPDLREPQLPQPGSTYVPRYAMIPPLGDPERIWHPIVPSEEYGKGLPEHERPRDKRRVTTTYPATNAPETVRSTGYLGDGNYTVLLDSPDAVNSERVIEGGRIYRPRDTPVNRAQAMADMQRALAARQRRRLPGLYGGGQ